MSFLSLPDEVILDVASWVQSLQSLNALCRVNRRLHSILEPELYRPDALHSHPYSSAVSWAAEHGITTLLEKALHYGTRIPFYATMGDRMVEPQPSLRFGKKSNYEYYDCKAHPLVLATRNGHNEIVNLLLERGCSPHMHDPADFSLLSLAVIQGHVGLIKTFLSLSVRQDRRSFNPYSPIQLAAFYGDKNIVELLLSKRVSGLHNLPNNRQMQDALETALKARHNHVVLQLLDHGMDLNFRFCETENIHYWQSPLEWVVEHEEDLEQVKLFLDKGANATDALLGAVKKGKPELVEVLVQKTDRVPSTRALCQAVDQQDSMMVNILLVNSVSCDFEESDRPRLDYGEVGSDHNNKLEAAKFIPPLVRAVNLGNATLVQLLIAHGANVNVGYHDLCHNRWPTQSRMSCGRAVQLAMDLGHQDIVHLLLESGADIYLRHPIWQFHACPPSGDRKMHRRVLAGLMAAASRTE